MPAFRDSGRPEVLHPVGDRFGSRQGRAAAREGPQNEKDGEGFLGCHGLRRRRRPLGEQVIEAAAHQEREAPDEPIGRDREYLSRFADSAKVGDHHQQDKCHADGDPVRKECRECRRDGRNARCGAHGDREDVIHQEGCARDQARQSPEIIRGHDIGPTAGWVGVNGLPVGAGNRGGEEANGNPDGDRVLEGDRSAQDRAREGSPPSRRRQRTSCPRQKMARAETLPSRSCLACAVVMGAADKEALQDGDAMV